MKGDTLRQIVTITNPQGFHMRPVQAFVSIAGPYEGTVTVARPGSEPVSGKSMWALFSLIAEKDHELEIAVTGPEADRVMQKLLDVFTRHYDEE